MAHEHWYEKHDEVLKQIELLIEDAFTGSIDSDFPSSAEDIHEALTEFKHYAMLRVERALNPYTIDKEISAGFSRRLSIQSRKKALETPIVYSKGVKHNGK